jgi:hypothetical protein
MESTLPPAAVSALDQAKAAMSDGPAATATIKTESPVNKPSILFRWFVAPIQRMLKLTTMTALTAAIVVLIAIVAGLASFITGGEMARNETMTLMSKRAADEVASVKAALMKPAPIGVTFKQGGVEGYGFIRNFFWRQDAEKSYAIAATLVTAEDGSRTLENTSVKVTSDGETFQLKSGTSDTWVLLVPPTTVKKSEETSKGGQPPVTAAK